MQLYNNPISQTVKAPVYLIQGDSLFIQEKSTSWVAEAGDPSVVSIENVVLADTDLSDALNKARNKPFFSELQIFIFQDSEELKASDLDLLQHYLLEPPAYSALFFLWNEDGKESNAKPTETSKRLTDLVRKSKGVVEAASTQGGGAGVQTFIRAKLKTAGKSISPQALKGLEQLGRDFPSLLDTAIENLILVAGTSVEITSTMVEAFDENRGRGNRFKLMDALLARRVNESLQIFSRLLDSGDDDPVMLIAFFHGQFRLYWQAQLWLGRGLPDSQVFLQIKLNPKRAVFFAKQMRSFSREQLEDALEGLFEIDRAVKIGEEEPRAGLEKWITRTTGFKPIVRGI